MTISNWDQRELDMDSDANENCSFEISNWNGNAATKLKKI